MVKLPSFSQRKYKITVHLKMKETQRNKYHIFFSKVMIVSGINSLPLNLLGDLFVCFVLFIYMSLAFI